MTGTFIGEKAEWGKGYGTDAARVRSHYAFEVLGLRLLLSCVFDGNERSLRMQKAAGYEIYGRLPKRWWKHGAYRDEVLTYIKTWEQARFSLPLGTDGIVIKVNSRLLVYNFEIK